MGLELGLGESLIIKAIAQSTGRTPQVIKTDLRKAGDLGLVAEVRRAVCRCHAAADGRLHRSNREGNKRRYSLLSL